MLSVIRDQGPCDLRGLSTNAGLAALYDRELGHLKIWPPEHFRRSGRVEAALADETNAARS
ncbi:hypothetical protein EMIT0194MI4_10559 [Pseudomonas sp. IT-194MI4]